MLKNLKYPSRSKIEYIKLNGLTGIKKNFPFIKTFLKYIYVIYKMMELML